MSLPEVLLWRVLKLRPEGLKFRRQQLAGPYVLDFYCAAAKLAVEVDGAGHNAGAQPVHDALRDAWLREQGLRVLRVPTTLVLNDLSAAIAQIAAMAYAARSLHHASHGPPPRAGEDLEGTRARG